MSKTLQIRSNIRLNNKMRRDVCMNLFNHRYLPRLVAMRYQLAKQAEEIFNLTFSEEDQKVIAEMATRGWATSNDTISYKVGEGHYSTAIEFNGGFPWTSSLSWNCLGPEPIWNMRNYDNHKRDSKLSVRRDVPHHYNCYKVDPRSELGIRLERLTQEHQKFGEEVGQAMKKAWATLVSFITVGKLTEHWPEVVPFLPQTEEQAAKTRMRVVANLPVVSSDVLNSLFDLPVPDDEAEKPSNVTKLHAS